MTKSEKKSSLEKVVEQKYKLLEECRICKSKNLTSYLDLGLMPLVNSYVKKEDINKEDDKFPLEIKLCNNCSLSQLTVIVNPEIMYKNYSYRSSISKTFKQHCFKYAKKLCKQI